MEIIERATMPNGTKIQIEDWSKDYSCFAKNSTIATYPVAKETADNLLGYPERGKTFRLSIQFKNEEEARKCFEQLKTGEKQLIDFADEKDKKYII